MIGVRGRLRVLRTAGAFVAEDAVDRRSVVFDQDNLIVNIGLQVFSRMLGGNAGAPTINGGTFADINDIAVVTMRLGNLPAPPPPVTTDITGSRRRSTNPR